MMLRWVIMLSVVCFGAGAALGVGTSYTMVQTKATSQIAEAKKEADDAVRTRDAAVIRADETLQHAKEMDESEQRLRKIIAVGQASEITRDGWIVPDGEPQRRITKGPATVAKYAPDGETFVVSEANKVYLGHADTLNVQEYTAESTILSAAFMPDGHRVLVTGEGGVVTIIESFTAAPVAIFRTGTMGINRADLSPDGHLLATAGADKRVMLWRFPGMTLLRNMSVSEDISSLSFSTNNSKLLVRFQNGTSYCINAASGRAEDVFVGPAW
jgi:WD40 repeat protein